jgi:hypothetical protein
MEKVGIEMKGKFMKPDPPPNKMNGTDGIRYLLDGLKWNQTPALRLWNSQAEWRS